MDGQPNASTLFRCNAAISTLAKPVESYVSEIWQAWASWKSRKPCELTTRSVDLEELPPCLWAKRICSVCQSVKLELINGNPAAANVNPSDRLTLVKSEESLFGLAAFCSSTGCPLFAVPGMKTSDWNKGRNGREALFVCCCIRKIAWQSYPLLCTSHFVR